MLPDKLSIYHVWRVDPKTRGFFFGVPGVSVQFSGCRGRCFGCESPLQVPEDIGMSPGNLIDRVMDFFVKGDELEVGDPQYIYLTGCDILSQGVKKIVEVCHTLMTCTDAYVALDTSGYPIDQLQEFSTACPDVHLFVKPYSRASGKFDFYSSKLLDILTSEDIICVTSDSVEDTSVWLSRLVSIMQSNDAPKVSCVPTPENGLREAFSFLIAKQEKSSFGFIETAGCLLDARD